MAKLQPLRRFTLTAECPVSAPSNVARLADGAAAAMLCWSRVTAPVDCVVRVQTWGLFTRLFIEGRGALIRSGLAADHHSNPTEAPVGEKRRSSGSHGCELLQAGGSFMRSTQIGS